MILLDVLPYPTHRKVIIDTMSQQEFSDTIRLAEETGMSNGASPMLNWTIPAILAALATCLIFIVLYRRRIIGSEQKVRA